MPKRLSFSEVRSEMAAQKIGVRQMAQITGCSPTYMSMVFNGKTNLTPHLAKKLEAVLSIEITDKPVTVDDLNSRLNAILEELLPYVYLADLSTGTVLITVGGKVHEIKAAYRECAEIWCPTLAEQLHARMSAFVPEGQ